MARARSGPGHGRWARAAPQVLALIGAMLVAPPAGAAEPAAAPPEPSAARIARAKDLFDKGYALLKAGACERAIGFFKRSLAEAPSSSSTMNAAYCLNELKRSDEALEMYEDLLITFSEDLSAADHAVIAAATRELRKKVGSLELSANVDAEVVVDGRARGKLPIEAPIRVTEGEHVLRLWKSGHETFERKVDVAAGAIVSIDARLKPEAPSPAANAEAERSHPFVSAFGGYALADSLGSTAERDRCLVSCSPVRGGVFGLRGGLRLSAGVAVELSFGYLAASSQLSRAVSASFKDPENAPSPTSIDYTLRDDLHIRGPFFGLGGSYRAALGPRVGLLARATLGVLNAQSTDFITGTARTTGAPTPLLVVGRGQVLGSQPAFVMPEIGVEARWGGWTAGVLLGAAFFTVEGPFFAHSEIGVERQCTEGTAAGSVGCAPNQALLGRERAYGAFVLWVPMVAVGYSF